MSVIEVRKPETYADVAALRGQKVLLYREFGSYQGEWILFASDEEAFLIYKGWYGSCSGCDQIQGEFDYDETPSREKVESFLADYRPFAVIPRRTARNLAERGTLAQVFPANVRDDFDASGSQVAQVVAECQVQIKLEEGMTVTSQDALDAVSLETRRRVIETIGVSEFLESVDSTELHHDGEDTLISFDGNVYLNLKDSSTPRRYLLQVPPEMVRVKQAKAWTFNLEENEYEPLIET